MEDHTKYIIANIITIFLILAIIFAIGMIIRGQVRLNRECQALGFDTERIDPGAGYRIQDGYISCMSTKTACVDGKCFGGTTYNVVKRIK